VASFDALLRIAAGVCMKNIDHMENEMTATLVGQVRRARVVIGGLVAALCSCRVRVHSDAARR
jgi:hypothetical protein